MSFLDTLKKLGRKVDKYLQKAEEIVEKAKPVLAYIPGAEQYVSPALKIIQLIEDLIPDAVEAGTVEAFTGAAKLEAASEVLRVVSPWVASAVPEIENAREVIQKVLDTAEAVKKAA